MSTPKKQGGWIGQHYDMLILLLVLLALLGSAGFLILGIGAEQGNLNSGAEVTTPANISSAESIDLSESKRSLTQIQKPFQSAEKEQRLMVSELRVRSVNDDQIPAPIPFLAKVCPYTGAEQPDITNFDEDGDGISDEDEKKYGLDPDNAADAEWDADGDGFSNLEEITQGSDPNDENVTPSILAKLRIARTITKPFFMRFQGVQKLSEEVTRYQLNLRSLEKTHFANMGDVVEGFTLVDFKSNIITNGMTRVDKSRLILEKGGVKETLVKGQVRNKSERMFLLISLLDKKTIKTRVGEVFTYRKNKFAVKDFSSKGLEVLDVGKNEATIVTFISEIEKMDIIGERDATPNDFGRSELRRERRN